VSLGSLWRRTLWDHLRELQCERQPTADGIPVAKLRDQQRLEIEKHRLAFTEDFRIELCKRTVLDLVPQANEELQILPRCSVIALVVLLQALLQLPPLWFAVNLLVPPGVFLPVVWFDSPLQEDRVKEGCPGDGHQDDVGARPEGSGGAIVRFHSE
jgi:hypothetical protein